MKRKWILQYEFAVSKINWCTTGLSLPSVLNCVHDVPSCLTCPSALRAFALCVTSCLTCLACPRGLRALKFIYWAASEILGLIVPKVALDSICWILQKWTTKKVSRESTKGTGKYQWRSSLFSKVASLQFS